MRLTKTEISALLVFKAQEIQSSWDWDADYRFADQSDDEESKDHIEECKGSSSPMVIGVYKFLNDKLTRRRIRALRSLCKKGLCESSWVGTGFGGASEFGIRRIRTWRLTELGRAELKDALDNQAGA